MTEFLKLLPPSLALEFLLSNLPELKPGWEEIPTENGLNRITSSAIFSPENLPAFRRSSVDGYAVQAEDTFGASDSLPIYLKIGRESPMGSYPDFNLSKGFVSLIHTGGMLPDSSNAVIMLENSQRISKEELEVMKPVAIGENVLNPGEDIVKGEEVIPVGKKLRAADIGTLMALGLTHINVTKHPKIAILSSGDEIVDPDKNPEIGQVRDVNSYSLKVLIEEEGGYPRLYGIIPDQSRMLEFSLEQALNECDGVVITAGSSASVRDLTSEVIAKAGEPGVLVHGVNVRPGKPTILAVCKGKPIIGLPGNPVSALVIARLFVIPVINKLSGLNYPPIRPQIFARLKINISSQAGREDWVPARLFENNGHYEAEPIFYKSNLIFTLAGADGLIYIPADVTGYGTGEYVRVELL